MCRIYSKAVQECVKSTYHGKKLPIDCLALARGRLRARKSRAVGPLEICSLDGGVGGAGGMVGTGGIGGMVGTGGVGGIGGAFSPGSRAACETCVGDADCGGLNHRCVEMRYLNQPYPNAQTGFCLKMAAVPLSEGPPPVYDCQAPYVTVLADRSSLSGGQVESYCGIREDFTTCAAVRAHAEAWPCTGVGDDACPDGWVLRFCENRDRRLARVLHVCLRISTQSVRGPAAKRVRRMGTAASERHKAAA